MYQIIIKQKTIEEKPDGKEWRVISKSLITEKEFHKTSIYPQATIDQIFQSGNIPTIDVYGYTPEIIKKVEVEKDILIQDVETLDLIAVIKAINGIE